MMITVKLTANGGYICCDGNIPGGLNPDQFYKLFSARIIRAKLQGLTELGFTDEEVERAVNRNNVMVDTALTYEHDNNATFDEMMGHPLQQLEDLTPPQIPGW